MYPVSGSYTSAVQAPARNMQNISVTVGGNTYRGRSVRGLTLHESVSENSDRLIPGCAACASVETSVVGVLPASTIGTELRAYHTLNGVTVPLGVFVVQKIETKPGTSVTNIVAYDKMCLFDGADFKHERDEENVDATLTFASLLNAIVPLDNSGDIKWATVPDVDNFYKVNRPLSELHGYNCKELLGYIAGAHGKFVRFTRDGLLEFAWYTPSGITIPRSAYYIDGLVLKSAVDTADTVSLYSNDDIETSGYGVYTNDLVGSLYAADHITLANTVCSPGTLRYRGDPSIQAGDYISVVLRNGETRQLAVSDHVLTFTGGLSGEIESHGLEWHAFHNLNALQRDISRLKKVYTPEEVTTGE